MGNLLTAGTIFSNNGNLYIYCPYLSLRADSFKCKEVTDDETKPLFIYKGKQYGIDASKLIKIKESERDNINNSIIGHVGANEKEREKYVTWLTNMGSIAQDMAQRRLAAIVIPTNLLVIGISFLKGALAIPQLAYNAILGATACSFAGGILSLTNLKYRILDKIVTGKVKQKPFIRSACRIFKRKPEEKIACPQITICDITPQDEKGPAGIKIVRQEVEPMKQPEIHLVDKNALTKEKK